MNKKTLANELILIVVTLIWGIATVYQEIGMKHLGPILFTSLRCFIAFLFLFPVVLIRYLIHKDTSGLYNKKVIISGTITGIATAAAMTVQQIGIMLEGAGKGGFITSLYIIFVPILGLFFKKKPTLNIVIALIIAAIGMYCINYNGGVFSFGIGSIFLLLGAILYAIQILLIEKLSPDNDAIKMSSVQFLVAALIILPFAFIFEDNTFTGIKGAFPALLFCGVFSSGIAFTLQIYSQKHLPASLAAVIMSFESVVSIVFSVIILKYSYGLIEIIGCILIFLAIIVVQIKFKKRMDN